MRRRMRARALRLLSVKCECVCEREGECVCEDERVCLYVCSRTWHSVRLLDFSGGWDEALETGSVFPSYSL
jgi:hypothetical protein